MASPTLGEWLREEPFGLTLSAGFFGFYAHTGFALALEEAGLVPNRHSGSSAGALVSAFLAAGRAASALRPLLGDLRRDDFWDPSPGFGLLRGDRFRALLERELPSRDFSDCARPLAVSAFDVRALKTRVISEGLIAPAVHASCVFPGLFHPVMLEGRPHIDGGVLDRSGLAGMPDGGRVLYHHLSTRSRIRRHIPLLSLYPPRPDLVPVVLQGLPRSGPTRLEVGPAAMDAAYRSTRAALARTLPRAGAAVIA